MNFKTTVESICKISVRNYCKKTFFYVSVCCDVDVFPKELVSQSQRCHGNHKTWPPTTSPPPSTNSLPTLATATPSIISDRHYADTDSSSVSHLTIIIPSHSAVLFL